MMSDDLFINSFYFECIYFVWMPADVLNDHVADQVCVVVLSPAVCNSFLDEIFILFLLLFLIVIFFRIGSGSGTEAVVVEQLTKVVEQQTIFGNQLQYILELVERKTEKKEGSKASVGEYNRFFSFSIFPAETWLTAPANTAFRDSARNLIRAHQSAMKIKRDAGLVNEVQHVQVESKELLQQLMDLYFHGQHVEILPERPYSCKITNRALESIRYSGKTDAVIKSTEYDIGALCWEIKNQLINLLDGGEIAQTAAEVAGELESMLNRFDVKPPRYAAVLTNGVAFLFVMATLVNGVYSWTHSPLVTNPASAAAMIEGSFAVAAKVLQLLAESFDIPIERLRLDDIDGDDINGDDHTESGGAGGGPKSGSMVVSLGGTSRALRSGASGSKSAAGANKKGLGTEKSGNSQDYRFAPLTIPNVDLFNRMRGSIVSF